MIHSGALLRPAKTVCTSRLCGGVLHRFDALSRTVSSTSTAKTPENGSAPAAAKEDASQALPAASSTGSPSHDAQHDSSSAKSSPYSTYVFGAIGVMGIGGVA